MRGTQKQKTMTPGIEFLITITAFLVSIYIYIVLSINVNLDDRHAQIPVGDSVTVWRYSGFEIQFVIAHGRAKKERKKETDDLFSGDSLEKSEVINRSVNHCITTSLQYFITQLFYCDSSLVGTVSTASSTLGTKSQEEDKIKAPISYLRSSSEPYFLTSQRTATYSTLQIIVPPHFQLLQPLSLLPEPLLQPELPLQLELLPNPPIQTTNM